VIKVKYDKPIEVTKKQYDFLTREFSGVFAHREEGGKYYIKVWHMAYAKLIEEFLNQ